MRIAIALVLPFVMFAACAGERPAPRVCEAPPPQKKDVRVGACTFEWPADGGTDALATDGATDARDARNDG